MPSNTLRVRVSEEIETLFRTYCEARGITISDFLRDNGLRKIGREDLIGTTKRGGYNPKQKPLEDRIADAHSRLGINPKTKPKGKR